MRSPKIIACRNLRQHGEDHPVEVTLAAPRFETGCWRFAQVRRETVKAQSFDFFFPPKLRE